MAPIAASYRVASPNGVIMLVETSRQNSMLVSTRFSAGTLRCRGPARRQIATTSSSAGRD
jgi:hypothetical protein